MREKRLIILLIGWLLFPPFLKAENSILSLRAKSQSYEEPSRLAINTNIIPWTVAVPNLGLEYSFKKNWSVDLNVVFSPWKISERFSVKAIAILPEGRYWLKNNTCGSYFNIHISIAWYNVSYHHFRYQDAHQPLYGAGIGYGYRWNFSDRWNIEVNIGAGFMSTKYDRFYNVNNGALIDRRNSTYWGIDRFGLSLSYDLTDI